MRPGDGGRSRDIGGGPVVAVATRIGGRTPGLDTAYAALAVVFIGAYVWLHGLAGYVFPVPWGDEADFLWQADAFARRNSLFAPELNPARSIMWMPPAYMLVVGAAFKVFGISLAVARALSAAFAVAAFVVLALMVRRYPAAMFSLGLCGLAFLNRNFVVAGNAARMEALLILVVLLGYWLLQRGDIYSGVAVLVIAPLVHPNGVYFAAAGVLFPVASEWVRAGRVPAPRRRDWIALGVSAAAWGAYAVYVSRHIRFFVHDISWQSDGRFEGVAQALLRSPRSALFLALLAGSAIYCIRYRLDAGLLLALAAPAWLVEMGRRSMWYNVFDTLAWLMVSLTLLQVVRDAIARAWPHRPPRLRWAVVSAAFGVIALVNLRVGTIEDPRSYPVWLEWSGMRMAHDVAYLEPSDAGRVNEYLRSLQGTAGPVWVEMYPWADAFILHPSVGDNVRFSVPIFHPSFFPPRGWMPKGVDVFRLPDVFIVHLSRTRPAWLRRQEAGMLERAGIDTASAAVLHRRDSTEVWYYRVARPDALQQR
jgi:hypothetical protein